MLEVPRQIVTIENPKASSHFEAISKGLCKNFMKGLIKLFFWGVS